MTFKPELAQEIVTQFVNDPYSALEAAQKSKKGSFVLSLCEALQHADSGNALRMICAFPDYFCELYEFWKEHLESTHEQGRCPNGG